MLLICVNYHPFWNPISLFALNCDRIDLLRVVWCNALLSRNKVFNSSLPLPAASRHLDISRPITAENSPLHIANSWTRTGNL